MSKSHTQPAKELFAWLSSRSGSPWQGLTLHGYPGTMQAGNNFPTESDPGATGFSAFLKNPKQCFSETCIREMKNAWTIQLFLRLCVSGQRLPALGLSSCTHRVKTFLPTPNPSLTQIWGLYYTAMYTELQDSCTIFWIQIWVVYFECFLILVWKGAFWFFLCTSMHAQ